MGFVDFCKFVCNNYVDLFLNGFDILKLIFPINSLIRVFRPLQLLGNPTNPELPPGCNQQHQRVPRQGKP
jgi:hypothetical protein